jgi:hypothetical protein
MKKLYLLVIFCFLAISCFKEKKEIVIESHFENEIIFGDGYIQMGINGIKTYEIHDADEFRSKLPFYNYTLETWNKNSEKLKFDITFGSIIYTINEYLLENNISNKKLIKNIIDVILGDIEEGYFAEISVFYNDINYGRFLFYYNDGTKIISVDYLKATGIDTYFNKRFQINNDYSIISNADYDSMKLEKMICLCNLYEYIINEKIDEIDFRIINILNLSNDDLNNLTNEISTNINYNYINKMIMEKIKLLFNYDDEICNIVMNMIINYIIK